MLSTTAKVRVTVLLTAVLGLLLLCAYQRHANLQAERNALQAQSEELVRLQEENGRLLQIQIDTNEVAQLRQEQRELLGLRGQAALLKQALRQQQAAPLSVKPGSIPARPD